MDMDSDTGENMLTGNPNRRRFSESAVYKAIVNAFVHRDYRSHDPVRVTLFNNRLEVTSPGGPNAPFDAGQIRKGRVHTSWRNPSLAWFMVELKCLRLFLCWIVSRKKRKKSRKKNLTNQKSMMDYYSFLSDAKRSPLVTVRDAKYVQPTPFIKTTINNKIIVK